MQFFTLNNTENSLGSFLLSLETLDAHLTSTAAVSQARGCRIEPVAAIQHHTASIPAHTKEHFGVRCDNEKMLNK